MKGKFRILGHMGLALFLAVVLTMAVVPATEVEAATEVTDVWVEFPSTDEAGAIDATLYFNKAASILLWRIHFTPTTALQRGVDTIIVQFYDGLDSTMGPTSTQDTYDVEFGGSVTTATNYDIDPDATGTTYSYYDCRTVAQAGYRVTVTVPCDIAAGQEAWLLIDDADGMITSGGPNNTSGNTAAYKVKVYTSQDTTPVLSHGFYHGSLDATFTSIEVSPSTAGSVGQYTFTFTPTSGKDLVANTDTITVTFPYGTTVPSSISASTISVYDGGSEAWYTCGADPVIDTDTRTVKVTVPYAVAYDASVACKIKFLTTAGIINPTYGQTDYGENDVDATNQIGFIRTSKEQLDIALAHGVGNYTITEDTATTLDFDYGTVTGYSDKYTMINMYSSKLYLQVEDQYGNLVDGGDTATAQVTLSSSSGTGNFYYHTDSNTAYTQITGTLTLGSGADEVFYRDSTAGTHTLTCTYSGLTSATQTMTVCPGASLYDRYDNLIHTYAPTSSSPVEETNNSDVSNVYKGGYYVDNAIDAATAYDKVVLGDGHYEVDTSTNYILMDEAYVTLKSLNGADSTTIDGTDMGADSVIRVRAANVTIDGLTIQGNKVDAATAFSMACDGIYIEYGGFTIQNCKFIKIPNDNIFVDSSTVAMTSGTITNNTLTGIGPGCEIYRGAIWLETYLSHDISGVSITNNTISNYAGFEACGIQLGQSSGAMSNITVRGNTISNSWYGITTSGGPTGMTDTYAMTENTITDCTIGLNTWGGTINPVYNFKNNTISGFTLYGIEFNPTTLGDTTDISIQYNDITGTGTWGIYNHAGTATGDPECKYNWFGDATGPSAGTGTYASTTARGSGEAVSKDITFTPWLHKPLADVVADNASYQAVEMKLIAGWNTLSTPVPLISTADSIDELIPSGMSIGYYYDGGWQLITTGYVLSPCDAVYVKMSAITYVLLKFDAGAFTTPSKDLAVGWNLVSLAYLGYTSGTIAGYMNADDGVASVAKTAANLPGYSQVISPSMNAGQTDIYGISGLNWAFAYGETVDDTSATQKMLAGLGYWIYMQNAATLAGFEITPIAPDLN